MLKSLIAILVRYSGTGFLIRETSCRKKVTVVLYHKPEPEVFKKHLEYMSKRYRFIRLDELVGALHGGDWSRIPPKALVVTFDDGNKENYSLMGLFREFEVMPTFYVSTGIVGTNRRFWFSPYTYEEVAGLRSMTRVGRAARLKEAGFERESDYPQREALSREELAGLSAHADIQSHGRFHEPLTSCDNDEKLSEIRGSMEDLERLTGSPARHFSYPHGDYEERDIELLKACGYHSARTVDCGRNGPGADPYRLKITGVNDNASVTLLAADLSGVIGWLGKLRHGSLTGKHMRAGLNNPAGDVEND
ncbi:MAG: polysaccharide deacetylase family protein [Nitrospirota bacterium]